MKLVLLGPPGAGKGTQAVTLQEKYQIPAISTGHIIRKAIREGTPVGKLAEGHIARGELVPDDVVVELVRTRLAEKDCENGYILDGFPRTLSQAQIMDKTGIGVDIVLNLEVEDEVLVERLGGRRECKQCGAAYHIISKKPKHEGVCDICGGELITRSDDVPDVIRKRLSVYHEQTESLKDYYQKQNKLTTVYGQDEVADTSRHVVEAIEKAEAAL